MRNHQQGRKPGHLVLEETRRKISAANKGKGHKSGILHTEETRARMSLAHKGLHHTEESKQKISLRRTGKPLKRAIAIQRKIDKEFEDATNEVVRLKWDM